MNWKSGKSLAILCLLFVSNLAHPQDRSHTTASIAGGLKGGSGAIVAVHLKPTTEDPVRYYDGYEAVPRPDGSFSFSEIPPGDYRLTAEAVSQLSMTPPGTGGDRVRQQPRGFTAIFPANMPSGTVHLLGGEHRKGVVIELTHKLSICGRVTHDIAPRDQWGRDIGPPQIGPADTSVIYFHYNREFHILENETRFDTEKDGSFRITDLAPGTYYMKVGIGPETWFPGSLSFSMAKPIVVGINPPATCNTDIPLPNNTGRYAALTSISFDGGNKSQRYKAAFRERNAERVSYFGPLATAYLDKPMAPGSTTGGIYAAAETFEAVLYDEGHIGKNLWGDASTQKVIFDSQTVTLKAAMDIASQNSIVFKPHPMASIQGEVLHENVTRDDFCPNCQAIYVSILRDGNGEFQTVDLSQGNHFDFHNVTPGNYQLFVYTTRPDKVFLKSIVAGGQTSQGRRFTIADAKFVPMTVTLSGNLAHAAGHISPDARHSQHWETEGMRPRASVSGRVVGDEGAVYTVRLLPVIYNNSSAKFTTQTAVDGSFHFGDVPPGAYLLRAHDKDYVRFDYGAQVPEQRGTPVLAAAGARLQNLTLRAPHRNSICGHVTNTNGEPQADLRITYRTAAQAFGSEFPAINLDSEGYFRIDGLLAADYFLAAMRPAAGDFLIALSSDGQLSGFKPVHVEDGKDVGCGGSSPLDLHVSAATGYFSISAAVTGELPARMGDRFEAELDVAQDMTPYWPQTRRADLSDNHHFHFDNIPPGQYRIRVYGLYGKKPSDGKFFSGPHIEPLEHLVASQIVTLTDKDLTDVALATLSLPTVTGTVTIPTLAPPWDTLKTDDLTIALVPHSRNGVSTAVLKDQGNAQAAFEIGPVDPGEYELRIQSTKGFFINSALYIQSVKLNGSEVDPLLINLSGKNAVNLHVDLGNKMASVRPHVSQEKAFAAPRVPLAECCGRGGGNYQVLLLPASLLNLSDDNQPQQSPRYEIGWSMGDLCNGIQSWETQAYNRNMENLPPGRYYALALQTGTQIDLGVQGQGAFTVKKRTLWKELAKIATPLTLNPGDHLELNLEDKTIEAMRIVAQVGTPDEQENLRSTNGQACCSR